MRDEAMTFTRREFGKLTLAGLPALMASREAVRAVWRSRRVRGTGTGSLSRSPEVDPVAVERAMDGDGVTLTTAERRAAVARRSREALPALRRDRAGARRVALRLTGVGGHPTIRT